MMRIARLASLGGLLCLLATTSTARSLPVELLAEPAPVEGVDRDMLFADTDHNGRVEMIFRTRDGADSYRLVFFEATNDGDYVEVHSADLYMPGAVGDFDGDGKTEFIRQSGGTIQFLEAVDAQSHPGELVWEVGGYDHTTTYFAVGDTDRDGRQECLFVSDQDLVILENYVDDRWHEAFRSRLFLDPWVRGVQYQMLVADFDGDGQLEIAIASAMSVPADPDLPGVFTVFEASTNDRWHLRGTWELQMAAPKWVTGGIDTDGNGRPELFIAGGPEPGPQAEIFEAYANDQFGRVESIVTPGPPGDDYYTVNSFHALCKLDGVRRDEYVVQKGAFLYVYRPDSPGHWSLAETIEARDFVFASGPLYESNPLHGLAAADINRNGRDELVWMRRWSSFEDSTHALILEVPDGVTATSEVSARFSVSVAPNPASESTVIRLRGTGFDRVAIRIVDARGRVVRTLDTMSQRHQDFQVLWDATDDSGASVASGVYRVVVSNATATESRKITIVR